jgi:hypothetical protein
LGKLDEGKIEIYIEPILIEEFLAEVREELLETLKVDRKYRFIVVRKEFKSIQMPG